MIVEIRNLELGGIATIYEKANPFNIRITIGGMVYRISEREDLALEINKDGQLIILPIASNAIKIK